MVDQFSVVESKNRIYFPLGEVVCVDKKSGNGSYLFAAILTYHGGQFLFSLHVARAKSPSEKIGVKMMT